MSQATSATDDAALPANQNVRLLTHIVGVMTTPEIVTATTSGSGKTMTVEHPHDDGKTYRLDTETILAGDGEYRSSRAFELYTPGRYRSVQRSNLAPGPQAGANQVSDVADLPDATHYPRTRRPHNAPDVCTECGTDDAHYQPIDDEKARCEECGSLLELDR